MNNRVTLKDIARETGFHVSTVSRALDPNSRASLTEEVTNRIKTVAEKMGYYPNRVAIGLRTSRTMTVGVMIPDITDMLFPPIVRGIENALEPLGYASIIVNTDNISTREHKLVNILQERGVDGIINSAAQRNDTIIPQIVAKGLPIVTLNRKIDHSNIPYIVNNEEKGIKMTLEYLFTLGHRNIVNIAGPQELSTGHLRLKAFQEVSAKLGLKIKKIAIAIATKYNEQEGFRCAEILMNTNKKFTAILCSNDRLALGALNLLKSRGLSCPADVSVTGFNDMQNLDLLSPRLTTIRIQQFEAGFACGSLLISLMNHKKITIPYKTVLPVELIKRDSVAPPKVNH